MRAALVAGFCLGASLLCGCATTRSSPGTAAPATPRAAGPSLARQSSFDFYLLNLSWSPEYCQTHASAAECSRHEGFVLHGLWPENSNGTYPEHCTTAAGPANPAQYQDLYPDPGLLEHEWTTHGTCSGLGPDAYFQAVRTAFQSIKIPPALQQPTAQQMLAPTALQGQFASSNPGLPASSVVVSCGNNYLSAVEVCLDKQLKPASCGAVRTCKANAVKVMPPA